MSGAEGLCVGCAGWSLPTLMAVLLPGDGIRLERYSGRFPAVEINAAEYAAQENAPELLRLLKDRR